MFNNNGQSTFIQTLKCTQHLGPFTAGPVHQPLGAGMDLALKVLATLPGLAQRSH